MKHIQKYLRIESLYWLIPIASIVMQFAMMRAGANQIRPEEMSESIRGPYWLAHGYIFQGLSSHIGWYAPLILWYQLFGFTLRGAADYHFLLHVISVVSLAWLLKKYINVKIAWIPLAAIVFSPTILYFNSLATQIGVDLQYLPICLLLLDTLTFKRYILHALLWIIAMIAWLSYPSFLYFWPILVILYVYKMKQSIGSRTTWVRSIHVSISIVSFLLPLMLGFVFVQNRAQLKYDKDRSGIFRGAAHTLDLPHAGQRIGETMIGFATMRPSYYYELAKAEFSDGYPMLPFVVVGIICAYLWVTNKRYRLWLTLPIMVIILNTIVLGVFRDTGGVGDASMRRATGVLAALYAFFVVACHYISVAKIHKKYLIIVTIVLFLIPFHHVLVFSPNLQRMKERSDYNDISWFHTQQTVEASFEDYEKKLAKKDLHVLCSASDCAYNRLYAVLESACYWNHRVCNEIWGWDPFEDKFVRLRFNLWDTQWSWEKYDSDLVQKMQGK